MRTDEIILHYGILGMRWGKRKSREQRVMEKLARVRSKDKKTMEKIGITDFSIDRNRALRNKRNREIDSKIRSLKANKKNFKEISKLQDERRFNNNLNVLADNRQKNKRRLKSTLNIVGAASAGILSIPGAREIASKKVKDAYYKIRKEVK